MSKKTKKQSASSDEIYVMEYDQYKNLKKHFSKTKAKRNFASIFGSIVLLIALIPTLFAAFFVFSTSIISLLESYGVITSVTDVSASTLNKIIGTWNSSVGLINWNTTLAIAKPLTAESWVGMSWLYFSISIILFIVFITPFFTTFSVLIGKANSKKSAVLSNLFITLPTILATILFVFGGSGNFGYTVAVDNFDSWIMYGYYTIGAVFVLGLLPLIIGKYRIDISVKY